MEEYIAFDSHKRAGKIAPRPRWGNGVCQRLARLPEQTRWATQQMLLQLDSLHAQIRELEKRLQQLVEVTPEMQWLLTLPGVGVILASTIALEIGEIGRFLSAERLASYAGTVPRVHSSGDRTRYGRTRPEVNRYLKWAFAEPANSTSVNARIQGAEMSGNDPSQRLRPVARRAFRDDKFSGRQCRS